MAINRSESARSTARIPNVSSQIDQLRTKLTGFAVRNNQGGYVGEVRDVQFNPTEQLILIVALTDQYRQERLLKVTGRLVRQVDTPTRSLLTHLHPAEVLQLPVWEPPAMSQEANPITPITLSNLVSATPQVVEAPQIVEEVIVPLLEERLVVTQSRRKVGEVIVRKEVVTEMIQVPVRREKLIVEQAGAQPKQLAVVDLDQDDTRTPELPPFVANRKEATVQAEFTSLKLASQVLEAIANQPNSGCQQVQISITLADPSYVKIYQDWLAQYAQGQQITPIN
jgi:sporulation protein YlmC with PRC-barrel domain